MINNDITSQPFDLSTSQNIADHANTHKKFDKRIAIAVVLGNTSAWADFALYAFFSPILIHVFFPFTSYAKALFYYFIIFAISFLFRPIGAAIAGSFADRYGRKNTLLVTVIISAIITALIGCLPSYHTFGYWSPVLLALLRIVQTMSIAAEPTNSSALLLEHADSKNRGFITSSVMSGVFLGFFCGIFMFLLTTTFLNAHQMQAWGWRIPFLSALVIGAIVSKLLIGAKESPLFVEKLKTNQVASNPIRNTFKTQSFSMFVAFGFAIMMAMGNYFLLGFMPNLLTHNLHVSQNATNLYLAIGLLVSVILIPVVGYISDMVGRRPVMIAGALIFIIMSFPMLYMIQTGDPVEIVTALMIYGVALAAASAVMPTAISEMFPFAVRCAGGAMGYNAALVLFGGTTPIFAEWLMRSTHNVTSLCWFIAVVAVIHLLFVILSKETKSRDISK